VTDVRILEDVRQVVQNEWPLKAVVIRPNAGGDDQHGDELTQFQQSTSLSQLATRDQPRLRKSAPNLRSEDHASGRGKTALSEENAGSLKVGFITV
jgi:hypothetical protein